jgi:hypothetical protein
VAAVVAVAGLVSGLDDGKGGGGGRIGLVCEDGTRKDEVCCGRWRCFLCCCRDVLPPWLLFRACVLACGELECLC